jgi:hypothetical protein
VRRGLVHLSYLKTFHVLVAGHGGVGGAGSSARRVVVVLDELGEDWGFDSGTPFSTQPLRSGQDSGGGFK